MVDDFLDEDLEHIGQTWKVPKATAAYWLLRGLIADARGEKLIVTGDSIAERLARWLVGKFPDSIGKRNRKNG